MPNLIPSVCPPPPPVFLPQTFATKKGICSRTPIGLCGNKKKKVHAFRSLLCRSLIPCTFLSVVALVLVVGGDNTGAKESYIWFGAQSCIGLPEFSSLRHLISGSPGMPPCQWWGVAQLKPLPNRLPARLDWSGSFFQQVSKASGQATLPPCAIQGWVSLKHFENPKVSMGVFPFSCKDVQRFFISARYYFTEVTAFSW